MGFLVLLVALGALVVTRRPRWQLVVGATLGLSIWLLAAFLDVASGWGVGGLLNAAAVGAVLAPRFLGPVATSGDQLSRSRPRMAMTSLPSTTPAGSGFTTRAARSLFWSVQMS